MAKKKEKVELVKKEEARPISYSGEMESSFDRFFRHPFSMMSHPMWPGTVFAKMDDISPSVDIFEDGDDVVVKADIPGISKDDLNVSISENTLTLSGEKNRKKRWKRKITTGWSVSMVHSAAVSSCLLM